MIDSTSRDNACEERHAAGPWPIPEAKMTTIYIIGFILDDSRLSPPSAVGANLNWINIYDEGESYTEHEHRVWMREAGFVDIERTDFFLAGGRRLITARKRG
jgi:hypothetical protein